MTIKTGNTLPEDLMLVVRTLEARYNSSVLQACAEGVYIYIYIYIYICHLTEFTA